MKSHFFTTKYIAASLVLALVGSLFFGYSAAAQSTGSGSEIPQPNREQILEALNTSLAEIATAIQSSPDVTTEERVELYLSLIEVSRAILTIQSSRPAKQMDPDLPPRPTGDLTLEEAGLYRVAVQLDVETFEAELTYYYTEDFEEIEDGSVEIEYELEESTEQLTIPADADDLSFAEKVAEAKEQVIDVVVAETDVLRTELDDAVYMSSRNPIRDVLQPADQLVAYGDLLFEDFGKHSIIDGVTVFTSRSEGSITLTSDQSETMVITLSRILPGVSGGEGGGEPVYEKPEDRRFTFSYAFYSPSINQVTVRERGEESYIAPTVSSRESYIKREKILEILVGFFGEMPFSDGIDDISEKTLDFLVDNTTVMQVNEDTMGSLERGSGCISDSDRLVMNEVLLQLIAALRAQFIVQEDIIEYQVTTEPARFSGDTQCVVLKDYF